MDHISVDIETMGTNPDSPILSIGAVAFDPVAGTTGGTFYGTISLRHSIDAGFKPDGDTIVWWMQQADQARADAIQGVDHPSVTLLAFFTWFREIGGQFIWGYGANFDEVLLSAAARRLGLTVPWAYGDVRCARTIMRLVGVKPDRAAGTYHNALDDAIAQAHATAEAYRKLGLAPTPV